MKFVSEYRRPEALGKLVKSLATITTQPWTIMEVCGGQTHAILKYGLEELLPQQITLLHGPGCPVCVTAVEIIDKAIEIASRPEVIFCSFGDMLRVPGSSRDLFSAKASGGDVRIVYSPLDALAIARQNPSQQVVFFAIGFETTAPANALAVYQAKRAGVNNFSVLVSQVLVPPALEAILAVPDRKVQAFLAPGHVCTVVGFEDYKRIASAYHVPIAVTGFEPVDLLTGIIACVRLLEAGEIGVVNAYARSVRREGNPAARKIMGEVFEVIPRKWRGIGVIPVSGLGLRTEFATFDAEVRFGKVVYAEEKESLCISGQVLQGIKKPPECPIFGSECTPDHPRGATMVSAEGACAAYYRYSKIHA